MVASPDDDTKDTAMSHTPRTPPLTAALEAFTDASSQAPAPDADDGLDLSMMKKKKKSKKVVEGEDGAVAAGGDEAEAAGDDAGAGGDEAVLDLSLKKKKKKKVKAAEGEEDSFANKLKALDLDKEAEEKPEEEEQMGDWEKGTGIWEHEEVKPIAYNPLLGRFYQLLSQKNPDHATGATRSHKIPPPQCLREGNKKTIFANLPEICKRIQRSQDHVTAFILSELGTTGSVGEGQRLVIKGRFQSKQLENVLRKYILDYVSCKMCRSPDTTLSKGENRLHFITCNACGSRRSVQAIKTGFSAQVGKRRKMRG